MRVQEHMIHGLLELGPSVAPVLFSDDDYYQSYCGTGINSSNKNSESNENTATPTKSRITCISDFETNPFHLPYIRSIFSKLTSLPYSCQFYGYLNGDILLSPQILDVLNETLHQIAAGVFSPHVLVVGRRTNHPWANVTSLLSGEAYRAQLRSFCSTDAPYMNNAIVAFSHFIIITRQDYFLFTPNTFNPSTMKGIVIGRTAVDGYLVSYVKNPRFGTAQLIDATESGSDESPLERSSVRCAHDRFARKQSRRAESQEKKH